MNAPADRGLLNAAAGEGATVYLMPGDWWFGNEVLTLTTLLGSCIAVALWHPKYRFAGMCHFLVPSRARGAYDALDGRYGEEAIQLLAEALARAGAPARDYRVHLLGGANMFHEVPRVTLDIGARNAEEAKALLRRHGFAEPVLDVGGVAARRIELEVETGRLRVRKGG